ncbi:unnamed protein product [Somion occarium]|uniref:Uncharacterized protein n=1 Tax=Somion occarium TaxID=3059160 RepID=A0ABP1CIY0_9APHY
MTETTKDLVLWVLWVEVETPAMEGCQSCAWFKGMPAAAAFCLAADETVLPPQLIKVSLPPLDEEAAAADSAFDGLRACDGATPPYAEAPYAEAPYAEGEYVEGPYGFVRG